MRHIIVLSISCLVGIVVVELEQLNTFTRVNNLKQETTDQWLNSQTELKTAIMEGLVRIGKENKLHSFEQVRDIHLTFEQWTPENGLLTPSMKPKRHEIKNRYKEALDKMYLKFD